MFAFLFLLVLLFVGSCATPARTVEPVDESAGVYREALWVSTDELSLAERHERLIEYAKDARVNTIYLGVYRAWRNRADRLMYDDRDIAAFIRRAHENGLEVWAAYGNGDWPVLGCGPGSFPRQRMLEVADFNRDFPSASFDGVMLDVEPSEPVDLPALIEFYEDTIQLLSELGMPTAAAIRYFWKQPVEVGGDGSAAAYARIIDLPFQHIVVMGYRNYAGKPCEDNGLICLHQDQVLYADQTDRTRSVLVGLRVTSIDADAGHPIETFHGMPSGYVRAQKERVISYFSQYASFGGFATHRYQPE